MYDNDENIQIEIVNKLGDKVMGSKLIELIGEYHLVCEQSLIVENVEYSLEQVRALVNQIVLMNRQQYCNVQFTLNDLLMFRGEEIYSKNQNDPVIEIFRRRLQNGFIFDPSGIVKMIGKEQQNTLYNSRDIFEFISNCQMWKKQDNQATTPMKPPSRGMLTKIPTTPTNVSHFQSSSFIYRSKEPTIDGIFQAVMDKPNVQFYLGYKFYSSATVHQVVEKCGWNTGIMYPFKVKDICDKLAIQKQNLRAATLALIHFDFERSLNELKSIQQDDEEIRTMIIAVQAIDSLKINQRPEFASLIGLSNPLLANHVNETIKIKYDLNLKMINISRQLLKQKQFTNAYLNLMAQFIINDNFIQYLKDNTTNPEISIFDRVGLWYRFLDKDDILKLKFPDNLDTIILFGRTERSVNSLQSYLDQTGDLQLSGVIAAHLIFLDYPQQYQLHYIFQSYAQLLENLQLFVERAQLLCEIQKLEQQFTKQINIQQNLHQVALACNYCKKSLSNAYIEQYRKTQIKKNIQNDNPYTIICPMCNSLLPKCMVCVNHFTLPQEVDNRRRTPAQLKQKPNVQPVSQAIVFCLSCKHGGHQEHIEDWFSKYNKCAVADCECQCGSI